MTSAAAPPFGRRPPLLLIVAWLVLFDLLLFVPAFALSDARHDWQPLTPSEHPRGAFGFDWLSAWEYLKALVVRRPNGDVFRVSGEWLLMVTAVVLASRRRLSRWLPAVFGGAYAVATLGLVYHHAYQWAFQTPAALWEDTTLALNLLHFLADSRGSVVMAGAVLGLVLAVVLVGLGAWWGLAHVRLVALERSSPRLAQTLVAACVWCAASLAWFGVARNDPVMQVPTKALYDNWLTSLERRAQLAAIAGKVADRRYDAALEVKLVKRPRVHLLMIEAYGQRLISDPAMAPVFRAMTQRVEQRLADAGLHARTGYSRAPIFGGRSWLSIGSVQTGLLLDRPSLYTAMEKVSARLTTLTGFFKAQGYSTLALQPGNRERPGLKRLDIFRRDVMIDGPDLGYHGPLYDWGQIPDQWSLSKYREDVLRKAEAPYFSFFMSVSTHHKWVFIPYVADWRTLSDEAAIVPIPPVPLPGLEQVPEGKPRSYVEAVDYEWRVLTDFILDEVTNDGVFIMLGDHQPLIERTTDENFDSDVAAVVGAQSLNTPLHIISRDQALLDRFAAKAGLLPGLSPPPGTGRLRHEGLFSLITTVLTEHWGDGRVHICPKASDSTGSAASEPSLRACARPSPPPPRRA